MPEFEDVDYETEELDKLMMDLDSPASERRHKAIKGMIEKFDEEGSDKQEIVGRLVATLRPENYEKEAIHDHVRADAAEGILEIMDSTGDIKEILDQTDINHAVEEAKDATSSKKHLKSIEKLEKRLEQL